MAAVCRTPLFLVGGLGGSPPKFCLINLPVTAGGVGGVAPRVLSERKADAVRSPFLFFLNERCSAEHSPYLVFFLSAHFFWCGFFFRQNRKAFFFIAQLRLFFFLSAFGVFSLSAVILSPIIFLFMFNLPLNITIFFSIIISM